MSGHTLQGCVRTHRTCVLWTGGKDSSLALYEAALAGYPISGLVTFVPENPQFLAHPLSVMRCQAEALGLPHHTLTVRKPFKESYIAGIRLLQKRDRVDRLMTGDIAEVDGLPNWIRECSASCGVEVLTPLWGRDRLELLRRLLSLRFQVIFSCVKKPWFTEEWLGMELDQETVERLRRIQAETGLDLCGEQGEYHTLVLDGPLFKKRIRIEAYSKHTEGSFWYLEFQKLSLQEK